MEPDKVDLAEQYTAAGQLYQNTFKPPKSTIICLGLWRA